MAKSSLEIGVKAFNKAMASIMLRRINIRSGSGRMASG